MRVNRLYLFLGAQHVRTFFINKPHHAIWQMIVTNGCWEMTTVYCLLLQIIWICIWNSEKNINLKLRQNDNFFHFHLTEWMQCKSIIQINFHLMVISTRSVEMLFVLELCFSIDIEYLKWDIFIRERLCWDCVHDRDTWLLGGKRREHSQ